MSFEIVHALLIIRIEFSFNLVVFIEFPTCKVRIFVCWPLRIVFNPILPSFVQSSDRDFNTFLKRNFSSSHWNRWKIWKKYVASCLIFRTATLEREFWLLETFFLLFLNSHAFIGTPGISYNVFKFNTSDTYRSRDFITRIPDTPRILQCMLDTPRVFHAYSCVCVGSLVMSPKTIV